MGFSTVPGWTTYNHYGPRTSGEDQVGVTKTEGIYNELVIEVDADYINDVITNGDSRGLSVTTLPAGAKLVDAVLRVDTAFSFTGGTSPSIEVGTEGSEATNGFSPTNAEVTAAGTYLYAESDFTGTWASELASDTQIGFALAGSPTSLDSGAGEIVIRYIKNN